jgi:acyl carrier protein
LDHHLNPVPTGVSGELYVGGDGLARGYFNSQELTAEKFIPHPFSNEPGARLYKTGDLARCLPDGNSEFVGRIDHQVKIRGFHIEPGEVETLLGQHPAVQLATVVAREDRPGEKQLVAYIQPRADQSSTVTELRGFLKTKLPDFMIPSAFVFLDVLPLTSNGKVDRRALPEPDQGRAESDKSYVAPRTPVEDSLAEIWAEVLKLERVGIHDNFFDLGGHSLKATQVMSRVQQKFQIQLPLRNLFETPTIAGLAESLEATGSADNHGEQSATNATTEREYGEI